MRETETGGEREGKISGVLTSDSLYWKEGFEMESKSLKAITVINLLCLTF